MNVEVVIRNTKKVIHKKGWEEMELWTNNGEIEWLKSSFMTQFHFEEVIPRL